MSKPGTWAADEKAARARRNEEQALKDKEQEIADRAEKIARLKALRLGTDPVTDKGDG